jgi:hypothetical protein
MTNRAQHAYLPSRVSPVKGRGPHAAPLRFGVGDEPIRFGVGALHAGQQKSVAAGTVRLSMLRPRLRGLASPGSGVALLRGAQTSSTVRKLEVAWLRGFRPSEGGRP